ncbi:MAG: hypothetical protein HS113_29495 [Verrucomicrobiales bacterium]|nr:hypothetical protein [Verrucomicrobiales bacterium]
MTYAGGGVRDCRSEGKISQATASYLIVDFGEETLDAALDLTLRAGLRYLYHGGPFRTWGHFDLHANQFPDGWASLKRCVERAGQRGVRLGVHTLSNFITPNDAYVTPLPDQRLARVGTTTLTRAIDATQTEIPVADPAWFNQMQNNTLKTAVVGQELIRYGAVSEAAPWRLLDCQRGSWGTTAAAHADGAAIAKLLDHGYRVFLTDATHGPGRRLADLFNETGLLQISFDGLEGSRSTGMGRGRTHFHPWLVPAPPCRPLSTTPAAVTSAGTSAPHELGEQRYAGFRSRIPPQNQNYCSRNLMPACSAGSRSGRGPPAKTPSDSSPTPPVSTPLRPRDQSRRRPQGWRQRRHPRAIRRGETARLNKRLSRRTQAPRQDVNKVPPASTGVAPGHWRPCIPVKHGPRAANSRACHRRPLRPRIPHPAQPLQFIRKPPAEQASTSPSDQWRPVLALAEPLAESNPSNTQWRTSIVGAEPAQHRPISQPASKVPHGSEQVEA